MACRWIYVQVIINFWDQNKSQDWYLILFSAYRTEVQLHIFVKKIRYADGSSVHCSSVDGIYKSFSHASIILKRIIMEKKKSEANYRQIWSMVW